MPPKETNKSIIQKRNALKRQLDTLINLFEQERLDKVALELRFEKLKEQFDAYELKHPQLAESEPNEEHELEFEIIIEKFYSLMSKIHQVNGPSVRDSRGISPGARSRQSGTSVNESIAKLPKTILPTFDGTQENWLSFKDEFNAVIGSQNNLGDAAKFQYLKRSLTGDAANKIKSLSVNDQSYARAWGLLTRAYDVKRLLVSRYYSLILNLPVQEKEDAKGIEKLADDMSQFVIALNSIGEEINSGMLVAILESKLHKMTLEEWEKSLDRESVPKIDDLYEFLYKTSARLSRQNSAKATVNKRQNEKPAFFAPKRPRVESGHNVFFANNERTCIVCKGENHKLFQCAQFRSLSVNDRIEVIKANKLCYNCMRTHPKQACKFSGCGICGKKHNTLLHLERPPYSSRNHQFPKTQTERPQK